jgi:hypothetical protein
MAIQKKSTKPAGITNESGEPEIVLAIGDKIISMNPPKPREQPEADEDADTGSGVSRLWPAAETPTGRSGVVGSCAWWAAWGVLTIVRAQREQAEEAPQCIVMVRVRLLGGLSVDGHSSDLEVARHARCEAVGLATW